MVFSLAAETGWSEERIMFMPLSLLTQYRHCAFRRNGTRTKWSNHLGDEPAEDPATRLRNLKAKWIQTVDGDDMA